MATYDLKYPGAAIDAILDTAYDLQNAGYIFRGLASEYSNTPTERSWVLAGEGETGHGFTSPIPKGYIGVCVFNGTSWTGKLLKCVSIDSTPTNGSTNAISSGGAYASISQLADTVNEALDNLTFTDSTPSAFLGEYITEKVSTTDGGIERILTYFTILAATTSKAGLLSAADKAKLDALWSSGYQFAGIATPSTTPISTTSKIFYIATEAGTYFNAVTVTQGINIIYKSGDTWSVAQVVGIDNEPTAGSDRLVKSGGVFGELALGAVYDVSAKNPTAGPNSNGKWESLSALLSDANLNTLIPTSVRKGGMSIKYVQSSDNKYIQARCMAQNFTTDVTQWQGVDTELNLNSKNLIESGAVRYEELRQTFNVADFFNIHTYIRPSDHQPVDNDNYRCTDYIKVKQGDIIGYRLTTVYSCGICLYSDKSFTSYVSTLVEDGLDRTEGTVTISQDGYILCCTQYGDIDNGYIYFVGSVSEKIAKLRKADEGLQENIDEQGAAITSLGESVNEQFDTDELLIANSLKRNNIGSSDFTRDVYIRPSDGYLSSSSVTKCTGFIPVVAGDVIKYKLFATGSLTTICALYSEADATKFVSMLLTVPNEGLYEGTITIPSNGYVVVQNGINYPSPYIAFKDVLDDKLDALDAESEKITTHHANSPMVCVFHDNYSRTMQNWEIGQNSAAGSTQNTYSEVNNLSQYDDGLRVDDGATFVVNSSRNIPFSLRKLNVSVDDDFVIETNVPSIANGRVCFGFDVIDIDNFTLLYVQETSSNRYQVILQQIINRSFGDAVSKNIYKAKAEVLSLCFIGSDIFIKLDDTVSAVMNRPVGMGKDIHIAAYKSIQTHFDFVNVFNYSYERTFNPNYLIDSGVSEIPTITTSANSGGYTIENTNVHYEGYADKFHLTPNDPEIHNGIRAERSVDTLISSNLRNFKVDFDVYIPSSDTEDNLGDIMCQMHDRDGSVARGKVPFILRYQNGKLTLSIYSTHAPQATTFITGLNNYELCSIAKDTWVHVEFEIKERYEKNQHPLTVVKVDGKVCYVSHKANCFNDVVPSELQYGIYKNASEWGTGVTERNRFFDNLIINYH